MGILPDTKNCELRMRQECCECFPHHWLQRKPPAPGMHHNTCGMHMPICMSGSLTCGGRENVPGISGACATCNFTYLARGPLSSHSSSYQPHLSGSSSTAFSTSLGPSFSLHPCTASSRANANASNGPLRRESMEYNVFVFHHDIFLGFFHAQNQIASQLQIHPEMAQWFN